MMPSQPRLAIARPRQRRSEQSPRTSKNIVAMKKIEQNRPTVETEAMSGPELRRHALDLEAKAVERFHAVPAVQKAVKNYKTAHAEANRLGAVALKRFQEDRPEPRDGTQDAPEPLVGGRLQHDRLPDRRRPLLPVHAVNALLLKRTKLEGIRRYGAQ